MACVARARGGRPAAASTTHSHAGALQVNVAMRELYLSDADFQALFGVRAVPRGAAGCCVPRADAAARAAAARRWTRPPSPACPSGSARYVPAGLATAVPSFPCHCSQPRVYTCSFGRVRHACVAGVCGVCFALRRRPRRSTGSSEPAAQALCCHAKCKVKHAPCVSHSVAPLAAGGAPRCALRPLRQPKGGLAPTGAALASQPSRRARNRIVSINSRAACRSPFAVLITRA